jgi:hypothetical protein
MLKPQTLTSTRRPQGPMKKSWKGTATTKTALWGFRNPRNVKDGEEESDDMSTALMIEQTKQPQHGSTDKIKSQR